MPKGFNRGDCVQLPYKQRVYSGHPSQADNSVYDDAPWKRLAHAAGEMVASKDFVHQSTAPNMPECVRLAEERMYAKMKAHAIASSSSYWQHGKQYAGNGDEFLGKTECLVDETGNTLYVDWGSTTRSRVAVLHQLDAIGVSVLGPGRFTRLKGWDARTELDKAEASKAAGYERMEVERLKVRVATVERERDGLRATYEREVEDLQDRLKEFVCSSMKLRDRIGTLLFEAARRTDELRALREEVDALRAKHSIPAPDPKPLVPSSALGRAWGFR